MGTEKSRKEKLIWTRKAINCALNEGRIIEEDKFIAEFCLVHFSMKKTALEILKQLETSGEIIRINNQIWTKEHYEAEQILKNELD